MAHNTQKVVDPPTNKLCGTYTLLFSLTHQSGGKKTVARATTSTQLKRVALLQPPNRQHTLDTPPPSYYTRTLGGHDCSTPLSCSCNAGCSLHHAARLSAAAAASCQGLARDEPRKHVQCLPGACLWHHVARALDSGITQAAVIVNHVASNLRSTHMTRHTTFDILNDYC